MTSEAQTTDPMAYIRARDASWTANYANMHSSDGYGQAAADRRALLGEIERLEFIQREFHNIDDVAQIRDLRVRLREALDIVRLNATSEQVAWMREVESELTDDVGGGA